MLARIRLILGSSLIFLGLLFSIIGLGAFSVDATGDAPPPAITPVVGENADIAVPTAEPASFLATNARAQAVREGKWPAQLAAFRGDIAPDRHGPQRNDPAEGVPKHAYSPFDERVNREHPCPSGGCEFEPGQVLVKLEPGVRVEPRGKQAHGRLVADEELNETLRSLDVMALEPIFPQAKRPTPGAMIQSPDGELLPMPDLTRWYRARIAQGPPARGQQPPDVYELVDALSQTAGVAWAEPDYLRKPQEGGASAPWRQERNAPARVASSFNDPLYGQQWHLGAVNAEQAWDYLASQGLPPGGSRDVVVAVIDTGVDYTHPDLAANMWVNSREIPGNGVDDDGNGFVDDVHGVNVVSTQHSGDPMDDHGHGTHVAGIIAAQVDNGIGGVGVAYNVQIMAVKAAQYSGVLSASDIAEAIYYAVQQGADVINMSFGGYARSQVEEDALAVAFGQAVLVAAAGNDGKVNLPCPFGRDMYPAAYNWVLGVMARRQFPNNKGDYLAGFSNYDCISQDTHEYEVMAPGVDVWSTLPQEGYAAWDGTSMATPVVSAIAALVRTKFADKDTYSSRFIMGQIATTGPLMQAYTPLQGSPVFYHVPDAYAALTTFPKPSLSYLEHWLFDTAAQEPNNDDDGIVDAGETVDLAIVIRNHWGKADPVTVTLEAWAEGAYQPDSYVTMITDTVSYGAIGSFNQDDNGLIYDDQGVIVGVRHPFRFQVDPDTPNDHVIPFKLTMVARNGLDPTDTAVYTFTSRFYIIVQRGRELPRIIDHDMVLTKDYYWIIPDQTLIQSGVTVTVTEGTQVQWGAPDPSDPYGGGTTPYIQVEGTLLSLGTYTEPVELFPSLLVGWHTYIKNSGNTQLFYTRVRNPQLGYAGMYNKLNSIEHSYIDWDNNCWGIGSQSFMRSIVHKVRGYTCGNGSFGLSEIEESLFDSSWIGDSNWFYIRYIYDSVFLQDNQNDHPIHWQVQQYPYSSEEEARNDTHFRRNAFLSKYWDLNVNHWMRISPYYQWGRDKYIGLTNNYWGTTSTTLIDAAIIDFNDDFNKAHIVYQPILTTPATTTYPFVVDVLLSTAGYSNMSALHGPTPIVGAEPVTFTVTFNRDMDTSVQPSVSFGPDVPETDYTIHPVEGGWVNPRTWQGAFNVTPITGDGYQLLRIAGSARAADDPWLVIGEDVARFRFEIQTSGTEAMNLQATGGEGYVDLMWTQDDFDLLAGFNIYRSTSISGAYTLVNQGLIPPDVRTFRDSNVQPGQTYYYKFTVVKTDMSESDPSNIASATPIDTIPPVIQHTPVTEAPPGLPLTLFADVTDNVGVQGVTLYYRHIGDTAYQSKTMVNTTGNRYSATIEGAFVTSPGIEYYIEATDGVSVVRYGRPEYPYQVAVVDRPVVTAVSPNRGPTSGGTNVTIAGAAFKAGASVTFGGAACSGVMVLSSSKITCITPPHYAAVVDVTVTNPDGQSGSLLRGFTYESDVASLSLPDTGANQHDLVDVPINASNVQGLLGADLTITYDPHVLTARGAKTGSLTPNWSLVTNTNTPGQITISLANSASVTGSGVLSILEFEVVGSSGMTTTLHFDHASLNDGAIPVNITDGSFSVNQAFTVSGAVHYWNGNASVPGVHMALAGDRVYTGVSDSDGTYRVSGAPAGAYTLTPSKSDDANSITAYDASLAMQHAAGLITLDGYAATAADVNKSGAITSMDAAYILQKAVDLITLPFPGAGVVWDFDPASRSYANLNSNLGGQDFTAVLLGDVSGNWSGTASVLQEAGPATLALRQSSPDDSGVFTVTLKLEPQQNAIHALDLRLSYDDKMATLLNILPMADGQGAMMQSHADDSGQIALGVATVQPLTQPVELYRFVFAGRPSQANLSIAFAQADEGKTPLRLVPHPDAGSTLYLPWMTH